VSTNDLEVTFQRWLDEPWDKDYSMRQQFWFAFKAGAEWALKSVRENAGLPEIPASAPPRQPSAPERI